MTQIALRRVDDRAIPESPGEIRASLVVRNEAPRLSDVLAHHRELGVDRFFVVDDGSDDGTLEFLMRQPDVHVFLADGPFHSGKSQWRRAILNAFCDGHWTLHLDADELFLHPGAEEIGLHRFCDLLDEEGATAVFASLVDMYPKGGLEHCEYRPGDRLIECFPYFDPSGYYLRFGRRPISPNFRLVGGARARVFFETPSTSRIPRKLAALLFDIRRRSGHPLSRLPVIGLVLMEIARRSVPTGAPNCGKVPLLRFHRKLSIETRCLDAMHYLRPELPLSECWASLLHFKSMPGMRHRVGEAAEKHLYGPADPEYVRYNEVLQNRHELVFETAESVRFESTRTLEAAGLMRRSPALTALLAKEASAFSNAA